MDISDEKRYAIDYTFAENLIDVFEEGEVSKENLSFGIMR